MAIREASNSVAFDHFVEDCCRSFAIGGIEKVLVKSTIKSFV